MKKEKVKEDMRLYCYICGNIVKKISHFESFDYGFEYVFHSAQHISNFLQVTQLVEQNTTNAF